MCSTHVRGELGWHFVTGHFPFLISAFLLFGSGMTVVLFSFLTEFAKCFILLTVGLC
jgi:hypothetical protein